MYDSLLLGACISAGRTPSPHTHAPHLVLCGEVRHVTRVLPQSGHAGVGWNAGSVHGEGAGSRGGQPDGFVGVGGFDTNFGGELSNLRRRGRRGRRGQHREVRDAGLVQRQRDRDLRGAGSSCSARDAMRPFFTNVSFYAFLCFDDINNNDDDTV